MVILLVDTFILKHSIFEAECMWSLQFTYLYKKWCIQFLWRSKPLYHPFDTSIQQGITIWLYLQKMHRFEYIKYVFFTNSNRSGVQILQYLIKRQSTNAMKSDLFLIPKNNITWAKQKQCSAQKKMSNDIQLKFYYTIDMVYCNFLFYLSDEPFKP